MSGSRIQEVTHFHFTAWPDYGVAHTTKSILDLVQMVKDVQMKSEGDFIAQILLFIVKMFVSFI